MAGVINVLLAIARPAASVIPLETEDSVAAETIDHVPHAFAFLATVGHPKFHVRSVSVPPDSPGDMGSVTTGACEAVHSDDAAPAGRA